MLLIIYNVEWNEDNWRQASEVIVRFEPRPKSHTHTLTSHVSSLLQFRILFSVPMKEQTKKNFQWKLPINLLLGLPTVAGSVHE